MRDSPRIHQAIRASAVTALIALLAAALAACGPQPKRALQMRMTPELSFVLTMQFDKALAVSDAYGRTRSFKGTDDLRFRFLTEEVDAHGRATLRVRVEKARYEGLNAPVGAVLSGKEFGIVLSPSGEIVSFAGTDDLRAAARRELEIPHHLKLSSVGRKAMRRDYLRSFSDDELRALIEPVFHVWPRVPVAVGNRWSRDAIYWPGFDVNVHADFQLESWDQGEAEIAFDTVYEPAGRRSSMQITGSGSGTIAISAVRGLLRRYQEVRKLYGTQIPADSGGRGLQVKVTHDVYVELFEE